VETRCFDGARSEAGLITRSRRAANIRWVEPVSPTTSVKVQGCAIIIVVGGSRLALKPLTAVKGKLLNARRAWKETVMADKPLMSFDELSSAAAALNKASNELTTTIATLDQALNRLNVGLTVWTLVIVWPDPDGSGQYEREDVGYSKVGGSWGLAIRKLVGDENNPEPDEVRDVWAFNDAPRDLRLRAVQKLPDLLDALGKAAVKTAEAVNKKLAEARAFTAALGLKVSK
jgi:hypothetical protein